ncbi:uracil-DNA glycosylase [Tranquillimonas alkanivorans]|nr:uracil-DNA glycosylase [Tranquillimonas alkanivorans]
MDGAFDSHTALEWLAWQVELGATEAIGDAPVNRYDAPAAAPKPAAPAAAPPGPVTPEKPDFVDLARQAAKLAGDLEALEAAVAAFEGCELKKGARNTVFCDGNPAARVMIIGEAPGADEDRRGRPFVGRAGQMLDRMFDAIGMGRAAPDAEQSLYITNVMPWRPPANRDPTLDEIAMMMPFVERHVELAAPDLIVAMGNISCQALLGRKGITRLRGTWARAFGLPVLPMFHPAFLLRNPHAKREAWADLLSLQARLRG